MVVLYAAFIGLLLASYASPLQQILESRAEIPVLEHRLHEAEVHNAAQERLTKELNTPAGIERANNNVRMDRALNQGRLLDMTIVQHQKSR